MTSERPNCCFGLMCGWCLLAAASGCSLHRTGDGIVLRSDWSLEYRRVPWLAFRSGSCADSAENSRENPALSASKPAGRPELLPWRSRLKGYRLGARIFRGKEFTGEQRHCETAGPPPDRGAPVASVSGPASTPPDGAVDDDISTTAATIAELQLPDSIGHLPESNRPDLVVD